jgi:hypothetical protein
MKYFTLAVTALLAATFLPLDAKALTGSTGKGFHVSSAAVQVACGCRKRGCGSCPAYRYTAYPSCGRCGVYSYTYYTGCAGGYGYTNYGCGCGGGSACGCGYGYGGCGYYAGGRSLFGWLF